MSAVAAATAVSLGLLSTNNIINNNNNNNNNMPCMLRVFVSV
ncbi:MAG TPA: hypothetical protein VIP56_09460 [Nitrososphaeraceae archaeon]